MAKKDIAQTQEEPRESFELDFLKKYWEREVKSEVAI